MSLTSIVLLLMEVLLVFIITMPVFLICYTINKRGVVVFPILDPIILFAILMDVEFVLVFPLTFFLERASLLWLT